MHRILAMIAVVLGIVLTGFPETVTNVRGSQRPNSNLVDIYYDLNATDGGTYTVEVAVEGRTNEVTATTFSGDVGKGIAPGKNRHILWEAGADWRDKKGDVKAVVIATVEAKKGKPKKVQLWAGGPYWADRNIGADNPWEYGRYFWWGDTVGHSSGYSFSPENTPTYNQDTTTLKSEGWITSGNVLVSNHDAAQVKCGGGWRMPTYQEFDDLISKCNWTWTTQNGVKGYEVRGRGNYALNSIFLPCAGYGRGTSLYNSGSDGFYLSSVPSSDDYGCSWGLQFGSAYHYTYSGNYRYDGFSVRPVLELFN